MALEDGTGALHQDYEKLREDHEQSRLQFINTELELAITFCQMAMSSTDADKAERDAANARKAYQTAIRRWETPPLGPQRNWEIEHKLRRVEQMFSDYEKAGIGKRTPGEKKTLEKRTP